MPDPTKDLKDQLASIKVQLSGLESQKALLNRDLKEAKNEAAKVPELESELEKFKKIAAEALKEVSELKNSHRLKDAQLEKASAHTSALSALKSALANL